MKDTLFRFLKNLLILTSIIAASAACLHLLLPQLCTPALIWMIPMFALTTYVVYFVLLKASSGKFNRFTNLFMAATVIKLLVMLAVISIYLYFFRNDAIRFAATMMILYLTYTFFEVTWLLRLNKTR